MHNNRNSHNGKRFASRISIERDRSKETSNLWYVVSNKRGRGYIFLRSTTANIMSPNDDDEYKSTVKSHRAYEKKACSMIYAQLLTNSSFQAGFREKKKNMNPRESCRINDQSVSFLLPAFSRMNEEKFIRG